MSYDSQFLARRQFGRTKGVLGQYNWICELLELSVYLND